MLFDGILLNQNPMFNHTGKNYTVKLEIESVGHFNYDFFRGGCSILTIGFTAAAEAVKAKAKKQHTGNKHSASVIQWISAQ